MKPIQGANWIHPPKGIEEIRDAARDLAQHEHHAPPGESRSIFGKVAQVLFLGTALVSGVAGGVHLWKELTRRHDARHSSHRAGTQGYADSLRREHAIRGSGGRGGDAAVRIASAASE